MKVVLEKCYMARLIQTYDHTKAYYSELKNLLLSYRKVSARISKKRESFRLGKNIVARFAVRGKTLCIYLPLDPAQYADTKYKVEDVSEITSLADTPLLYRIKNGRRFKYAKDLIETVMAMLGVDKKRTYVETDFAADIAFRTTGTLIGDGLIKRKLVKASEALFGTSLEDLPEQEAQALLAEAEAAKAEEAADAETNADEVAAEETDVAAESDADTTDDVAVSSEEFDAAQDETDANVDGENAVEAAEDEPVADESAEVAAEEVEQVEDTSDAQEQQDAE